MKCYAVWYEHLSDMLHTTLEISVTQLRPVTEIAAKSPFLCVNRSPIQYGFPAGAKAIQCSNEVYIVFYRSCTIDLFTDTAAILN